MSDLNLKCPADFQGGIQDDWDNDYASMWAQVQSLSHNKMQYRKAWMAAKDENARLQSEVERLRVRCEFLEGSIKNAIGWIDGDLRDIIRDVGNQICSYNDLYESADRIEHLLAEALRQQAAESEKGGAGDE